MYQAGLGLVLLALAFAPSTSQLGSSSIPSRLPPAAPGPSPQPAQGVFAYWFEARGLPPEQAEVIAIAFGRVAEERGGLVAASRPEEADLIVQLAVGGSAMNQEAEAPRIGAGVADTEAVGLVIPEWNTPTIEVHLDVVDILDGAVVSERRFDCELPLTQGRSVASSCLPVNFQRIVQDMAGWAERAATAAETTAEFGPSEDERRRLQPVDLASAYYRESIRASQAGFEGRALDLMAEAQPLFKQTGLRREEGAAWEHVAYLMAATYRGPNRAVDYAEQTIRIARELADPAAETRALNLLAACEARTGNYRRAERIARSAAARARESGDSLSAGTSLAILAGLAAVKGNLDQARALQSEALELVRASGNAGAEARLLLSMAAVTAQDDDRERSASLARLEEVRDRARQAGDLALLRDAAFVQADTRYATTELATVVAGEVDAIRALKLSRRLDDRIGQTAAIGLLGAFAVRLGKPALAYDYLVLAQAMARETGFLEALTDSVQVLGEISSDLQDGAALLEEVALARAEQQDLPGQIKTLSDISRFQSGLERIDDSWDSYRSAVAVTEEYARQLRDNDDREDIRASFTTVLKSLVATRTELPYLARYLMLNHIVPLPNPNWFEG